MKVALVGAGGMGKIHLSLLRSMDDVQVVAVVDVEGAARANADDGKTMLYRDIHEMLANEQVDIVDVCTPTYLHAECSIAAMERGIHVLCEKPIALTMGEAEAMVSAARSNGVLLMIAHVIRFWPEYQYLKKAYDEKTFGELLQVSFSRIGSRPRRSWQNWMMDEKRSGRVPLDLHIHDVDFIVHMLGVPDAVISHRKEDGDNITYISTQYRFDKFAVQAEAGWFEAPLPFGMSFRAVFERAALEYKDRILTCYELGKEPVRVTTELPLRTTPGPSNGYFNELRYFIECVRTGKQPELALPESTLDSIRVLHCELESAAAGRTVPVR